MTVPATPYTAPWIAALGMPGRAQAIPIPIGSSPGIVTVMPVNDKVGRPYLRHHVYIHDAQLDDQIRLDSTHLAYVPSKSSGQLEIAPISRWWGIGSAMAIPSAGVANLAAVIAEPSLPATWTGPATLVELGPVTASLPVGYQSVQQVHSVLLSDLLAAARAGGTLLSVPKI